MHCEQATELLIEYATGELDTASRAKIGDHLDQCDACREEHDAIRQWMAMSGDWHEEVPPSWKPPAIPGRDYLESFRQWFPSFASAAALAMVGLVYLQPPQSSGVLPQASPASAEQYQNLPVLPKATQAAMVESVMEGSRAQRQEELQALLKILKAEMDRRSIETEESMRYIISHQVQGQQELDDLYAQVEAMMNRTPAENQTRATSTLPNEGVSQ